MKPELILKNVTAALFVPGVTYTGLKCNGNPVDVSGYLSCEHKLYSTIYVNDLITPPTTDETYPTIGQYRSQHPCPDFFGFGCPQDGRSGVTKLCTRVTAAETVVGEDRPLTVIVGKGGTVTAMGGATLTESYNVTDGPGAQGVVNPLTLSATLGLTYDRSWKFPKTDIVAPRVSKEYGIYVANVLTRRTSGYINYHFDSTDNKDACETFDVQQRFEKMERYFGGGVYGFVKGVYRLCESDSYPVPYCVGEGAHWG
ncbi:hypothetical protein HDU96_001018 [Phlyctochytrium bullatum]|nr:hypothetical protein HDU96_001018 [Phlyctochytrium bullatum]